MKLKTHSDGSIWTRDGHLLWYYPNREVQQQESPAIQSISEWDAHTGKYAKLAQNKELTEPQKDSFRNDCQVNEVCIDGACVQDNFFNSDLIQTAERTHVFVVIDASTSWIVFDSNLLQKGDVLHHQNNNCIEILDDGIKIGVGKRYKFVAKPAVHSDALRAGEQWTLIQNYE